MVFGCFCKYSLNKLSVEISQFCVLDVRRAVCLGVFQTIGRVISYAGNFISFSVHFNSLEKASGRSNTVASLCLKGLATSLHSAVAEREPILTIQI